MTNSSTSARYYAKMFGWHVLPLHSLNTGRCTCGNANCTSPAKHPLTQNGVKDVSADPDIIAAWWQRWPTANVGVATGAVSGFFVLDVDGDAGAESLRELEAQHGKLPDTVEQLTGGGGRHVLFRMPKHAVKNAVALRDGLDIRGDGGYIVVAPSVHSSGRQYAWELSSRPGEVPLADAPEWLLTMLKSPVKGAKPAQNWEDDIPEGQRNAELAKRAGTLLARGIPAAEVLTMVGAVNAKHCKPPVSDAEVATIVRSIAAREGAKEIKDASLKPGDFTDVGEANVLAREYGEGLRFSEALGWIVYDQKVWVENDVEAQGLAQLLTERQLKEARSLLWTARAETDKNVEKGEDKASAEQKTKSAEQYRKFVLGRRASSAISAALKEARPALHIEVSCLDADPFLLNTPAGAVDLRTGKMRPHSARDYCTKMTTVSPNGEGAAIWGDFIKVVTCGRLDLADYLQLLAGEAIIGRVYRENLQIAFGSGKNCKSTYYNTLARSLGDYSGQISAETLTTGRKTGKNWELAELRGKRLILAPELGEGTRLDTAFVKKICSTDKILGEQKFKTPFSFEPSHTTVLYTNHLPRVGSSDKGTWRRLVPIPFNATIGADKDIKNYADLLVREAGGAVLTWAIEGARRLVKADFRITVPACALQAAEEYREANDWIRIFVSECCEVDKTYTIGGGELYQGYRSHAERTGEYIRSNADFKAAIELVGYEASRMTRGIVYRGLRLNSDFHPGY